MNHRIEIHLAPNYSVNSITLISNKMSHFNRWCLKNLSLSTKVGIGFFCTSAFNRFTYKILPLTTRSTGRGNNMHIYRSNARESRGIKMKSKLRMREVKSIRNQKERVKR